MRRYRRFPLFLTILTTLIAVSVGYVSFLDVSIPQKALQQVGSAVSSLGDVFVLLGESVADEGFSFSDVPAKENSVWLAAPKDAPVPLLVNRDHPLDANYAPVDLVNMRKYCDSGIVYIKGGEIDGVREAVDALMMMFQSAIDDGVSNWQISAGYRSVSYQQKLWDNQVYEYRQQGLSASQAQTATAKYVAKPGCSEHHTGLSFDVTVPGESFPLTTQSKWLDEHCWDFGFIIRYAEDKQPITGINAEPWHIRYVGQPHAKIMKEKNLCLEEYIASLGQ